MYTIVIFKKNWADEIDCEEFNLVEGPINEVKEKVIKGIEESNGYGCFGTNMEWSEEYGECITIHDYTFRELSCEEAEIISEAVFGVSLSENTFKRFGVGSI